MSLVIRRKRDGRRAPGYLVYLLAGAAAVAAVLILARGPDGPRRVRVRPRTARPSNVESVTEAAATMAPVEVEARPAPRATRSYRLKRGRSAGGPPKTTRSRRPAAIDAEAFDAIAAALRAPAAPAPAGVPGRAPLPPAFAPEDPDASSDSRGGPRTEGPQLFGYRDPAADPGPPARPAAGAGPESGSPVPLGTLLPVVLLTTVDTGNPAAVLQFAAARPLVFRRRRLLPFGTRFLGRLAGPPARDRLNLAVDRIVSPDGAEWPLAASAVEADETGADLRPGLAARYVPPPEWARLAPYLSEAVTGYLGLLQSRAGRSFTFGAGGLSFTSGASADARAPLEQASAQAIEDFTRARLREMEERCAGHFLIPAGTDCWLQLDADLDLRTPRPGAAPRG